jgi:hypothetical protein
MLCTVLPLISLSPISVLLWKPLSIQKRIRCIAISCQNFAQWTVAIQYRLLPGFNGNQNFTAFSRTLAVKKPLSVKIYYQAKKSFFCALARKPVALLRGLCDKTALGLAFYPSLKLDSFAWISPFGTYIVYNSTTQRWNIAVRNFRVQAVSPALEDSLLLGISIDALFQVVILLFPAQPMLISWTR